MTSPTRDVKQGPPEVTWEFLRSLGFTSINESNTERATTMLLYGNSGSGKTWFAGTAGRRTLYINLGKGLVTLNSPGFRKANPNFDVSTMIVKNLVEDLGDHGIVDKPQLFDATCQAIDMALEKFPHMFDTIVVDDASYLRKGALNKGLLFNQTTGRSQTRAAIDKYNVSMAAVQDFGAEMNLIEQFVAGYTTIAKEVDKNFILLAHERITYTKPVDREGRPLLGQPPMVHRIQPGFIGEKFPDEIVKYFDCTWRAYVVGASTARSYRILTEGNEQITARTRANGIFKYEINQSEFTLSSVLEKIRNASVQL